MNWFMFALWSLSRDEDVLRISGFVCVVLAVLFYILAGLQEAASGLG